jgi:hypothetical protein
MGTTWRLSGGMAQFYNQNLQLAGRFYAARSLPLPLGSFSIIVILDPIQA